MKIRKVLLEAVRNGHEIHAAVNASDTPLIGCLKCGGWTEAGTSDNRRKFLAPCGLPSTYGATSIRALRDGRHPTRDSTSRSYKARHSGLVPIDEDDFLESSVDGAVQAPPPPPPPVAVPPAGHDAFAELLQRVRQRGRRRGRPSGADDNAAAATAFDDASAFDDDSASGAAGALGRGCRPAPANLGRGGGGEVPAPANVFSEYIAASRP